MISIIVPIYNVETYLSQCLDSLINQTYRDIEIICVNDGATDGSLKILEEHAAKDDRIKIINQPNQGLSGARNTGIKEAKGEWTMFVDSDDWMDTNTCSILTNNANSSLDLLFFSYIRERMHSSDPQWVLGTVKRNFSEKDIEGLYARLLAPLEQNKFYPEKIDSMSTAWGKLYKTSIIQENNLQFVSTKTIGTEDLLFNVYYFKWIKEAVYLPNTLYHYRKNNITSLTKLYKPKLVEQWDLLFSMIEEWIRPLGKNSLMNALGQRRALSLLGLGLNVTFSGKSIKEKIKDLNYIINNATYQEAIHSLPISKLGLKWQVFYSLAKNKCSIGVLGLLWFINKMISR